MKRRLSPSLRCAGLLALLLGACEKTPFTSTVAPRGDWTMYGGTNEEQRFSPLKQINEQNIGQLGLVWDRELGTTRGLEATPLFSDGVIYTTGEWSVAYAIDAKSGEILWTFDPKVARTRAQLICCDTVNRGVALYEGKVYLATLDGRLIALDAKTGKSVWEVITVDQSKPYSITGAPRIAKGKVLIGNAGSEFGVRGFISAYDAQTGNLLWRTFTVPGDPRKGFESKELERAAKTWNGQWWVAGGGGTPWDSIVYDPDLDLIYLGTGNGTAWYRDLRSPGGGDNLYLASILALRAASGELAWHFQVTPGENWDYDATQPLMLADLTLAGATRKVILQASKNGFFYVLDRQNGQFLSAQPFVRSITWATGVDPKSGRPLESASGYKGLEPVLVSPDVGGAHNWYPMAFHPTTGLVYIPAREGTFSLHAPDKNWKVNPKTGNPGNDPRYEGPLVKQWMATSPPTGKLIAWNPAEQRKVWEVTHPVLESGGVLATGGNLVFQGRADGELCAYRATDGQKLWEFDTGTGIMAPPITYLENGIQYLTLMVGWGGAAGLINPPGGGPVKPGFGRILTFAIGGNAKFEIPSFGHKQPPSPSIPMTASAATVHEGALLYNKNCFFCHGVGAVAGSGIPDLRYATAETHHQFEAIVLGGAREQRGMPSFKDALQPQQVRAIDAYVLSQAAAASKPSSSKAQ